MFGLITIPAVLPDALIFSLMVTVFEVVPPSVSAVFADQEIGAFTTTFPAS